MLLCHFMRLAAEHAQHDKPACRKLKILVACALAQVKSSATIATGGA